MRYCVMDPTGNVTILVESDVAVADQPRVARALLGAHPEAEQVGFVRYAPTREEGAGTEVELRMAGGEFCGNATMSAAARYLLVRKPSLASTEVCVRASGSASPLRVALRRADERSYDTGILMPAAQSVRDLDLVYGTFRATVPVVSFGGIDHVVIDSSSPLYGLAGHREAAQGAAAAWCRELGADGLGLMFLRGDGDARELTPLVYVPAGDTLYWENSCASGSAAVGVYLARREGVALELSLHEPGGTLRVRSDPRRGQTWLFGHVRLVSEHS